MLSTESVESLLSPISEALPSGDDLEHDAAFMALERDAQPKAEQQFGATVIAAVEPEWRDLTGRATDLLKRSKDVRTGVLALRAATHTQGIEGFSLGLTLLLGLIDRFWDTLHPQLDAEDDNDPTMRLNALAPLADGNNGCVVLSDLHDCVLGTSRTVGTIRVRDIAIAHGKLTASSKDPSYSLPQVTDALLDIYGTSPQIIEVAIGTAALTQQLQALIEAKTGQADPIDLKPLRSITHLLRNACQATVSAANPEADVPAEPEAGGNAAPGAARAAGGPMRGEISTRQDALQMLDKVIAFLEKTEPGNPAPMLIKRAKRLVGVSFIDIMNDLAPDAINSIQNITGKPV